jgi:hypothetical protein
MESHKKCVYPNLSANEGETPLARDAVNNAMNPIARSCFSFMVNLPLATIYRER